MPTKKLPQATGKVQAVKVEGKKPGLSKFLATADKGSTAKKEVPKWLIDEPTPGQVAKVIDLYTKAEDAATAYKAVGSELKDAVTPLHRQRLQTEGYVTTVRVVGKDGEQVELQFKHKYGKIDLEQADEIRAVVGDKYDSLFTEARKIEVKPEIAENDELLGQLIAKLGDDAAKYFNVTQFIKPTEKFTHERFKVLTGDQNAALDPLVKQEQPALKVANLKD